MAPSPSIKKLSSGKARSDSSGISKSKNKSKTLPSKRQKTKPLLATQPKKKRRIYTEKELEIPKLNMITPIGVEKPRGKKKGKVFVDDQVRSARSHFGNKQLIVAEY
jgi:60S ribosomal subunit assembly/export protein LOC1